MSKKRISFEFISSWYACWLNASAYLDIEAIFCLTSHSFREKGLNFTQFYVGWNSAGNNNRLISVVNYYVILLCVFIRIREHNDIKSSYCGYENLQSLFNYNIVSLQALMASWKVPASPYAKVRMYCITLRYFSPQRLFVA